MFVLINFSIGVIVKRYWSIFGLLGVSTLIWGSGLALCDVSMQEKHNAVLFYVSALGVFIVSSAFLAVAWFFQYWVIPEREEEYDATEFAWNLLMWPFGFISGWSVAMLSLWVFDESPSKYTFAALMYVVTSLLLIKLWDRRKLSPRSRCAA